MSGKHTEKYVYAAPGSDEQKEVLNYVMAYCVGFFNHLFKQFEDQDQLFALAALIVLAKRSAEGLDLEDRLDLAELVVKMGEYTSNAPVMEDKS